MRKFMSMLLAAVLVLSLAACGSKPAAEAAAENKDEITFGFIYLHDEHSTYDKNFMDAAKAACEAKGVKYLEKVNVSESNDCYEAACDFVDRGANLVFADSFGHESFIIQAAKEYPNVLFAHGTGQQAHTENIANFGNAFAAIYDARYLVGIAAGMKLNEMIANGEITADQAKLGYVGAFNYAEVISGYSGYYLGAKSVCPSVTMEVQFTGDWLSETLEKEAAQKLINNGCVLISGQADSMGMPTACEEAGVVHISYNKSTKDACPNSYLVAAKIDWQVYFEYMIDCYRNGQSLPNDFVGTLQNGMVKFEDINEKVAAAGTREALEAAQAKLMDGSVRVFDTKTFTVDGKEVTSFIADVDADPAYTPDTEAVHDGYFHESEYRSAPYFNMTIDGIFPNIE